MSDTDSIAAIIVTVRQYKVMLDADLAALYGVETKALNRAVKRNLDRFPEDFMFQSAFSNFFWERT
jgi:ORF6N domain.